MNQIKYRKMKNSIFHGVIFCVTLIGIVVLVILLADIIMRGVPYLTKNFFTSFPSRFPKKAGILPGIYGSVYIILLTILFAVPIGLGTAVYLEEYAKNNRFTKFIKINISNLSGTPSIVYGLLGLTVFVKTLGLGKSIVAGALTMSLVVLPIVIVSSQEAIKAVPQYLRHGSYALGATKWQTIRKIVIPTALPGIFTGVILSVSRALGETAPLIMVGAATYVSKLPEGLNSIFTALPLQIYYWMGLPKEQFKDLAAAGIIVLLAILLTTNAITIVLRNKYQKSVE
ncbi:phosphate ABC transporter permease PstA [Ruminiclostridium cellulolyticum]|uniref:Phosphate transport system permease protein PstA n=1 Tax=Ruminiclostridium cellulolyticum (strain ATCC 35319 / DSM 5812 / JCM 6584 / H10) TaxID=394503 RepID=B8I414_RUMCH|nr:phosphate ABC transporter permease PstA [Ruminiclostridium cellulolyticum]ACL76447.1 phosphate ABC transporter, inner membrane subunit PstA [Ruminiclostridium cellulolyticum H10]